MWIIRARDASSITFRLVHSGLSFDGYDYINIAGFSHVVSGLADDPRIFSEIQLYVV